MPTNMMTLCKQKAVLVAVYEEKPRKRRSITSKKKDNKYEHHHHHHHHHHLHIHPSNKNGEGNNRRAELLSYSQHLRESSKSKSSTSPHHRKSLVASSPDSEQAMAPVLPVQKNQKLKKKPTCLGLDNLLKCFAISHANRKVKNKKKKSSKSSTKKADEIMKKFSKRTQKGASRFFSKLMATIQKYR